MNEGRVYEPHIIKDPMLPFIFHINMVYSGAPKIANWHNNLELLWCIEGSGVLRCESVDITFEKGDVLAINSNELHMIYSKTSVKYYCLITDSEFCKENGIDTDYIQFSRKINSEEIVAKFQAVTEAYSYYGVCRAAKIRLAVLDLIMALRISYSMRDAVITKNEKNSNTERIKRSMVYISQNLSKVFTLDEIASYVGVSKFYFTREFRRITGQTVFEYINIVRCKEAKRLISEGASVSSAARSCGFENMSYFSRTYKKYVGCSPSEAKASAVIS